MAIKRRKKRVPQLKYTKNQKIGWHVSYRDPVSGMPRRHRFGLVSREKAEAAYHEWMASHLRGETVILKKSSSRRKLDEQLTAPSPTTKGVRAEIIPGSLIHITTGFINFEESRVGEEGGPRRQGTITRKTCDYRTSFAREFLKFLNSLHGQGAVGRMRLADLTMHDVESYNRLLVEADYSASQVKKRLQVVKAIIDRAGRPEHDEQLLPWNWDSRDVKHGKATKPRQLPTLRQLKLVLSECNTQYSAMVWMAIGCGFGPRDLAAVRVGQFDETGYDLRRGKTGMERYGETPPMVWKTIAKHLSVDNRQNGQLMFITQRGFPLVHGKSNSIQLWWARVRRKLGKEGKGIGGFYTLRHLGATEFGTRRGTASGQEGTSLGDMKRWLGHSASSAVADVYLRDVKPEQRELIEWVRESLQTGKADLKED